MGNSFTTTTASGDGDEASADLIDTIEANAAGPKRVTGDQGTVEQHSLQDQIAFDKYKRSLDTANSGGIGIRFRKIIPPNTD
jgi:hypothetical protein